MPSCFCELSLLSNVSGVVATAGAQSRPLSAALIVTGECATGVYSSTPANCGQRKGYELEDGVRIVRVCLRACDGMDVCALHFGFAAVR